jgi:hypothetical protein
MTDVGVRLIEAGENGKPAPSARIRRDRLMLLKSLYCRELAEDKMDGTPFDNQVLDAIDALIRGLEGGGADHNQGVQGAVTAKGGRKA